MPLSMVAHTVATFDEPPATPAAPAEPVAAPAPAEPAAPTTSAPGVSIDNISLHGFCLIVSP